jgi:arginase family enzyme
MSGYHHLSDFLEPVSLPELSGQSFHEFQFGHSLDPAYLETRQEEARTDQVVVVGMKEQRGDGFPLDTCAPDLIRRQLYSLYRWHDSPGITDLGNVRPGATLKDSYVALRTVVEELLDMHKTVIILGGSHDLTHAQYQAYFRRQQIIEATVIDALIDMHDEERIPARHFLMEMLTGQPNFIGHYNHIGFQSYFVHPRLLETLDKLRFDCYRLGNVRENLEEMEPVIRQSHMVSLDMCALRSADSPASRLSPNGFAGEEMCTLMRYAGMSSRLSSIGLYGYRAEFDRDDLSAMQAAQMIWYFLDGLRVREQEADLDDPAGFLEFHVSFTDVETSFLKSRRTGRWWMQLPAGTYIPCAYNDYITAGNGGIPERWLRAQERL